MKDLEATINEASKYGSVVVGLMTDEAMISYKRKPITSYKNRAAVVEHLKMVDYVYPLDGIDYAKVANKFKLDFFLHGDDWLEKAEKKAPFKRLTKAIDVARAAAYLCSEESGLVTGSIIDYDQSVLGWHSYSAYDTNLLDDSLLGE